MGDRGGKDPDQVLMEHVKQSFRWHNDDPGTEFHLVIHDAPSPEEETRITEQAEELTQQIARELAAVAPAGWRRLNAVFSMTVRAGLAVCVSSDGQRSVPVEVPEPVIGLVKRQRELAARLSVGPWRRLVLSLASDGTPQVTYDYGDEPFPDDQILQPEDYVADVVAFPPGKVPVWLGAYMGLGGRQRRSPQQAASAARADRAAKVWPVLTVNEFPAFPAMWARWATIAAAFVAVRSERGPRMMPSFGCFEASTRSGSTLFALPGGRAVLSGGTWNAPVLEAAYNGAAKMPRFYAGAPDWVANPVLNPRADAGLLSFCYWWDAGRWYRGESPPASDCAGAVPGVWTRDTVTGVVARKVAEQPGEHQLAAAAALVSAAEAGAVTREAVTDLFGEDSFDVDGAMYQFTIAGLVATVPGEMPSEEAIARVRQYILGTGLDTRGYPLSELTAERFSVGWMVYVPVPPGEVAIGRAIFYIADDGVLEPSSSSVAPSRFIAGFEQRFRQRHGSAG
jgi:hypothetical protein